MNLKLILIGMLLTVLISCAGSKNPELDPTKQNDKQLYEYGMKMMEEEDYQKARDAFRLVFDNFPKSEYRILAKIGYADSFYNEGNDANWILAIQEYQDFITLFPFSPKAAYAQAQVGMCYYNMMEKSDRDQTNTRKALDEFRKVIDSYPESEYYKSAYDRLIECYSKLAEHEYIIARYYTRTGKPNAAIDRLKALLKTYPESVHTSEHYYYLARSLEETSQMAESCTYYRTLIEKWPDNEHAVEARESATRVCDPTPAR